MRYLPTGLKYFGQYIALALLAVFMVTFVPLNLLHHHAEHEHMAALLDRSSAPEVHHCELDSHFCQPHLEGECGHEAHLQESITKCFSCTFHFIKHFEHQQPTPEMLMSSTEVIFQKVIPAKKRKAIVLQSNKGPPCFAVVV